MSVVNQLHDAYRRDFEAAKALVSRASEEARELSAEEEAQYSKLNESMDSKLAKIEDLKKGEERSAKLSAVIGAVEVATSKTIENDADALRA